MASRLAPYLFYEHYFDPCKENRGMDWDVASAKKFLTMPILYGDKTFQFPIDTAAECQGISDVISLASKAIGFFDQSLRALREKGAHYEDYEYTQMKGVMATLFRRKEMITSPGKFLLELLAEPEEKSTEQLNTAPLSPHRK